MMIVQQQILYVQLLPLCRSFGLLCCLQGFLIPDLLLSVKFEAELKLLLRLGALPKFREVVSIVGGRVRVTFSESEHESAMADSDAGETKKMASRIAIVRGVPDTFCDALSMTPPPLPVDRERARLQHAAYVDVLEGLVQEVIELPADNKYPDCPFIEDTTVVIGNRALITHPGAASRQGEEDPIREALKQLGIHISEVEPPGAIDGGDVLYASGMLFAGNSSRTNEAGIESLQKAFPDVKVHTIGVVEGLHLKSAISSIAPQTLAVEDSLAAMAMFDEIQRKTDGHFKMVKTVGPGAANTVLVGDTVICSATLGLGSLKLEAHYKQHSKHVIPVNISEFHKVDGGLTCLSLLIER